MPVLIGAVLLVGLLASKPTGRRFLVGHHLDGKRRSDGTWLHRGRNGLDISGHVSSWAKLAGWERASFRLAAVLGPVVAQDKGLKHREWIDCPPDYRAKGVTVTLPRTFAGTEDQQDRIAAIAAGKLGGEWEPTFNMQGHTPTMTLQHSPEPPSHVGWDDVAPEIQRMDEGRPVLGLGSRGLPVVLDFTGDTPHVLVSVPSGGGKSIAARIIAAHVLHHGGQLLILDYKKISHAWAADLPGVTYARTAGEIHDALLALQQEIAARYESASGQVAGPGNGRSLSSDVATEQPLSATRRLLVIVEELNSTADILQAHWANNRPRGVTLQRSPAVMALQAALYTGRQANVNVLALSQKGTANAFGGSSGAAARENATAIIGANSSASTWSMLAPDITPPLRNTHPGRMHTVIGDSARAVQVGYITDQQARDWATSGAPATVPAITGTPAAVTTTWVR